MTSTAEFSLICLKILYCDDLGHFSSDFTLAWQTRAVSGRPCALPFPSLSSPGAPGGKARTAWRPTCRKPCLAGHLAFHGGFEDTLAFHGGFEDTWASVAISRTSLHCLAALRIALHCLATSKKSSHSGAASSTSLHCVAAPRITLFCLATSKTPLRYVVASRTRGHLFITWRIAEHYRTHNDLQKLAS